MSETRAEVMSNPHIDHLQLRAFALKWVVDPAYYKSWPGSAPARGSERAMVQRVREPRLPQRPLHL